MRKGGKQPSPIKAGKKILPMREPTRPTIIHKDTIMVLKEKEKLIC